MAASATCTTACYSDTLNVLNTILNNPNYSTAINPSTGTGAPTTIIAGFLIVKLLELTNNGNFRAVGSLSLMWDDPRLSFNPANYNGVTVVEVPAGSVWTPQISLFNGISENLEIPVRNNSVFSVSYSGAVRSMTNGQFPATCKMDLTYFPYDTQTCTLQFVSIDLRQTYVSSYFYAAPFPFSVLTSMYSAGGDFSLTNMTLSSGILNQPQLDFTYPVLNATLTFQRNPDYYVNTVAIPSVLLLVASAMPFFLPSDNSVKIAMSCALMTALYVLQQAVSRMLPATKGTPLIATGIMIELWLGCYSLGCAVLTVFLRSTQPPLGRCCIKFLTAVECLCSPASARAKQNQVKPQAVTVVKANALQKLERHKANLAANTDPDALDPLEAAIISLANTMKLQEERQDRAEQQRAESNEHTRHWKTLDIILNAVLFIIYFSAAFSTCYLFLFGG